MCWSSWNLGASTSWNPQDLSRDCLTITFATWKYMMSASQMKTFKYFYLIIYWTLYGTTERHGRYDCADPWLIQICGYFIHCYTVISFTMASTFAVASGVTTRCAWLGREESLTELMPLMIFLVHWYTCCSDGHASPCWTFIRRWLSMVLTPSLLKKTDDRKVFFFAACCKRCHHLYTTAAPSCCIPASYCHLSATLQTMNITVFNLQDSRAVFQIFITLLRFSFDSPLWDKHLYNQYCLVLIPV
jgi:hypothetical protein